MREYALVSQEQAEVHLYRRAPESWDLEICAAEDHLRLESVHLDVPVSAIYEDV